MHEDRYIQVEENVYIDTKDGLTPPQRALIMKVLTYGIGTLIVCGLVLTFYAYCNNSRDNARSSTCQSWLKQNGLAMLQYAEDYDGRYPRAAVNKAHYSMTSSYKGPYGWATAIQLYTKADSILLCPAASRPLRANLTQSIYTDYWFNRNLSHAMMKTISDPASTFMLGDGFGGSNARASLSAFPATWKDDHTSPLWRHLGGANYAFADGHVEWLSGDTAYKSKDYYFGLR